MCFDIKHHGYLGVSMVFLFTDLNSWNVQNWKNSRYAKLKVVIWIIIKIYVNIKRLTVPKIDTDSINRPFSNFFFY